MKKMISVNWREVRNGGKKSSAKWREYLPRGIILRTSSSVNRRCEEHNHTFFFGFQRFGGRHQWTGMD